MEDVGILMPRRLRRGRLADDMDRTDSRHAMLVAAYIPHSTIRIPHPILVHLGRRRTHRRLDLRSVHHALAPPSHHYSMQT